MNSSNAVNTTTSRSSDVGQRPITSVLVANRGEIARRVFATCRMRGLATVAVFSDADADMPHVGEADAAVRLPGNTPAETYLRGDLIIAAAHRAGADAIHPGYGFLSENADFARQVQEAGLIWIGPGPVSIDVMGSKIESKERMAAAGVPVLTQLEPDTITEAELPVLVKASFGGGGRGMRIVRELGELHSAVESASREAASAFGDPTVFCERYLESGHHVEVQVMADAHGTVWALGERECSLQRRHQKVIEEAPSPLVERIGQGMRDALLTAARDAASAVDYRGAGTVEFLADADGAFFFLEMNTRLQVEHPVTECVTGTDLVGLQIDVADGLPLLGKEPQMSGHSMEARLYAEDPAHDWQPQSGTLASLEFPQVATRFAIPPRGGIRFDSGVEAGSIIGTHYDAMIAKVISHAATRKEAARDLASALRQAKIHGLKTNRDLLVASLLDPEFLSGHADTSFYSTHPPQELTAKMGLDVGVAAVAAALGDAAEEHAAAKVLSGIPSGFRNVGALPQSRTYAVGEDEIEVRYRITREGLALEQPTIGDVELVSAEGGAVTLELDGVRRTFALSRHWDGAEEMVSVDGPAGSATLRCVPRFVDPSAEAPAGTLVAQMPGSVVRVDVKVGDVVEVGQPLVWLEAMKMEHVVLAPTAGTISELPVAVGAQVSQGTTLAVVDAETDSPGGTDDAGGDSGDGHKENGR